jgi:hypothetical protein
MGDQNSHNDVEESALDGVPSVPAVQNNTNHRNGSGSDHADVATNTVHRTSNGDSHSNVILNSGHRVSNGNSHSTVISNAAHTVADGKSHSDVVLNNAHRVSDGKNHADVVSNNAKRHDQAHALAGADHTADSLANLNSKINTLIATYGGVRDIGIGTIAQRPAAGTANRFWWATDEKLFYRDNGVSWDPLSAGASFIPLYGESEGESINSSPDTWAQKLRVSITPAVSADYRISWYCELRPDNSGEAVQLRVELDDTTTIGQGNVVHPYPAERYEMQSGFKI